MSRLGTEAPEGPGEVAGASSDRLIGRAIGPVGRRPPGGATGGGSFSPTPGPIEAPTTGFAPVCRAGAGAAAAASAGAVGRRGAPGNGGGGGGVGAGVGGRRRTARSPASAGTSAGGFQLPSFSFQTWTSAPLGSGATLSMSCLRENGPVRLPSSAMYQATPSSAGGSGRGAARRSMGAVAGGASGVRGTAGLGGRAPADPTGEMGADGRRIAAPAAAAPSSRTVMMFVQDLQRTLRIFPRTFSSAIEYLVWQRSQTNFMQLELPGSAAKRARKRRAKLSSKGEEYHRPNGQSDEAGEHDPASSRSPPAEGRFWPRGELGRGRAGCGKPDRRRQAGNAGWRRLG